MKSVLVAAGLLIAGALVYFSLSTKDGDDQYAAKIMADRLEKDIYMKEDQNSPFGENRDSATALVYFPPDEKYRLVADLEPIESKRVVVLPTSSGVESRYLEFAWALFELDGVSNKLLILEVMDMGPTRGQLFLAFADATSAHETYGGGRYLDLKKIRAATTMELDFNKAYNPYCAYNDSWSCPLPPRENLLKIPIRAGEMNYRPAR